MHITKSDKQLKANYTSRITKGKNNFPSFDDFKYWYDNTDKICFHCGLTEEESQEIVLKGILTSNRFPQNGIVGRGQARGMWLEVDQLDPKGNYSKDNCVLSCYFCNNDKSDVFYGKEYKKFFQNRVSYLRDLLTENRSK